MRDKLKNLSLPASMAGVVIGAVAVFAIAEWTTDKKLDQYQLSLEQVAVIYQVEVTNLVNLLASGGAPEATNKIIIDCSTEERNRFELLLMQLDGGLSKNELTEVDGLFGRCAATASFRRALTLIELSQKTKSLETIVAQRKQVGSYEKYDQFLTTLRDLITAEQEVTQYSFAMVYLQREIIDVLRTGEADEEGLDSLRVEGSRLRTELQKYADSAKQVRATFLEKHEQII